MKKIKHLLLVIPIVMLIVVSYNIAAQDNGITLKEGEGEVTSAEVDYAIQSEFPADHIRSVHLKINPKAGKRLVSIAYKEDTAEEYTNHPMNMVQSFTGDQIVETNIENLSIEDSTILFTFEDYEPATISYVKYLGNNYNESAVMDSQNYEAEYTPILENYKGGDLILPSECTENGCMLKIAYSEADFNLLKERVDSNHKPLFGDSHDHIQREGVMSQPIFYNGYNLGDEGGRIYVVVNKYFTDFGIQNFTIGDNINKVLSEDFIGFSLDSNVSAFNDSIAEDGFVYFSDYNNYKKEVSLFYGVSELYASFYEPRALNKDVVTNNMGKLNYVFDDITSGSSDYQIDWSADSKRATIHINSFYEQEYKIDMNLRKEGEPVKTIQMVLNRFAFAGNAGQLLLVDENNNVCPKNNNDNCYYSTEYRGIPSVFYTTGESKNLSGYFEWSVQGSRLEGDTIVNPEQVFEANKNFHPWAIAMYYNSDDEIVKTKSIDLGEIKAEGISSNIKPENDEVNDKVWSRTYNDYITGYDKNNFDYVSHGLGKSIAIKNIDYYTRHEYKNNKIIETLKLISKQEATELGVNKISLFLANGELKPEDGAFPKLTYGVGQGKVFVIDGRIG